MLNLSDPGSTTETDNVHGIQSSPAQIKTGTSVLLWSSNTFIICMLLTGLLTFTIYKTNQKTIQNVFSDMVQERHQEILALEERSLRFMTSIDAAHKTHTNEHHLQQHHTHKNDVSMGVIFTEHFKSDYFPEYQITNINSFVMERDVASNFPGIYSFGIIARIQPSQLDDALVYYKSIYPSFQYQSLSSTDNTLNDHWLVVYSQNFHNLDKLTALGFDSLSDPITYPAIMSSFVDKKFAMSGLLALAENGLDSKPLSQLVFFPLSNSNAVIYTTIYYPVFFETLDKITNKYHKPKWVNLNLLDANGICIFSYTAGLGETSCSPVDSLSQSFQWNGLTVQYLPTPQLLAGITTINIWLYTTIAVLLSIAITFFVYKMFLDKKSLERVVFLRTLDIEAQRASLEIALDSTHRFVANMSHELRTPLNAIMGINQILAQENIEDKYLRYISISQDSAKHLLELINDILDMSKIDNGSFDLNYHTFDIDDSLSMVINSLSIQAKSKGIVFKANVDPTLPKLLIGDSKRLRQILLNIGGNAIKFTDDGYVNFDLKVVSEESDSCKIMITFTDTGIGMSKDTLNIIFNPFKQADDSSTRSHSGTGLGLFITDQLVSKMSGFINVESTLGSGSCFTVTLPFKKVIPSVLDTTAGQHVDLSFKMSNINTSQDLSVVLQNMTIVILDDVPTNTMISSVIFENAGANVTVFNEAVLAIEYCLKHVDKIDLLLCDIQMPILNGYEVTQRLRAHGFNKPIIGLSGLAYSSDYDDAMASGMTDYLTKPLDIKLAVPVIKRVLKSSL